MHLIYYIILSQHDLHSILRCLPFFPYSAMLISKFHNFHQNRLWRKRRPRGGREVRALAFCARGHGFKSRRSPLHAVVWSPRYHELEFLTSSFRTLITIHSCKYSIKRGEHFLAHTLSHLLVAYYPDIRVSLHTAVSVLHT